MKKIWLSAAALLISVSVVRADDCIMKATGSVDIVGPDDRLMLSLVIDGTGGNFDLDLASGVSKLHHDAADGLGIRTARSATDAAELTAVILSLDVGDINARGVRMRVTEEPSQPPLGAIGALGIGALESRDVELDILHQKVNLFLQDHCPGHVVYWSDTAVQAPLSVGPSGDVTVEMALDGKPLRVKLDSLREGSWISTEAMERIFGQSETSRDMAPAGDIAGHKAYRYRFSTLGVGGLSIGRPNIVVIQNGDNRDADLHIGMGLLRQLRLFFAFKERKLYITAAQ
jgi:hypothetical protein